MQRPHSSTCISTQTTTKCLLVRPCFSDPTLGSPALLTPRRIPLPAVLLALSSPPASSLPSSKPCLPPAATSSFLTSSVGLPFRGAPPPSPIRELYVLSLFLLLLAYHRQSVTSPSAATSSFSTSSAGQPFRGAHPPSSI